jgi:hypothetical protein
VEHSLIAPKSENDAFKQKLPVSIETGSFCLKAYFFVFSGYKKTPITALFSHLKHPFTKVNYLVSSRRWRDESLVLNVFLLAT